MKKTISILLIFLIIFQLFGFFAVFRFMQLDVKRQIKKAIKYGVPENELVILKFPNDKKLQNSLGVKWIEGHEFTYKGNMYDVVKTVKKGVEIIYYCLNDKKEKALFANLKEHIDNTINNDPTKSRTLQLIKKLNLNFLINKFEFSPNIENMKILFSKIYKLKIESTLKEVLTPPPQF